MRGSEHRSPVPPDASVAQAAGTAPAGLALDLLQLAGLAASASSAASATAYAVDAVVKEALLFFAIMPQDVGLEALGQRPGTGAGEEVFRVFGQRAHADARAANDAFALAHQLVANASRGGRSAGSLSGGNLLAAALAAGRVGTHADRTAATAREGAQLCMGILEDAVQVNASALARETAKRCAEQALRSIEAATCAEQHSRSLRDVLAHTLSAAELQARAHSGNTGLPCDTLAALAAAAPSVSSRQASPDAVRWWQEIDLASVPKEASIAGRGVDGPVISTDGLARHLEAAVRRCRPDEPSEDDMQALAALVEWRFAKAASLGLQEEEVLQDEVVTQLVCWSPDEEAPQLPMELQNHVKRCGRSLVLALKAAFFQPDAQEVFSTSKARRQPFPGTFQTLRRGVAAEEGEWENLCDQLGWVSSVSFKLDKAEQGQDLSSAVATTQSWVMAKTAEVEEVNRILDPTDQDWSVDQITLRQLHALSNRSRSSKTQSKRSIQPSTNAAEKPSAQASVNTVDDENQVRRILTDLLGEWDKVQPETLGGRGFVEEEALPRKGTTSISSTPAYGADLAGLPLQWPTTGVAAGASAMSSSNSGYTIPSPNLAWQQRTAVSQTAGPTRVKQTPLGLGVDLLNAGVAGGHEPATVEVSASSPVHKLVEPPHLLRTALECTEDDQDDEDGIWPLETELPTNRKLHSFGEFRGGRGSSYLPGQLLQQRLPRTFNESMGHVAQERREAYGMHGVHGVPGLAGLGHFPGTAWPPRSLAVQPDDDGHLSNRARTFNGSLPGDRCGSSPVQTPAGTFIATPTWSESGEFATRRDDPCSPLYIQATPQRWASEHCQEMSQASTGLPSTQAYRGFAGLLARSDPQSFYPE